MFRKKDIEQKESLIISQISYKSKENQEKLLKKEKSQEGGAPVLTSSAGCYMRGLKRKIRSSDSEDERKGGIFTKKQTSNLHKTYLEALEDNVMGDNIQFELVSMSPRMTNRNHQVSKGDEKGTQRKPNKPSQRAPQPHC